MIMHKKTILKKISFIIVNYQSAETLSSCVMSIKKCVPPSWHYEIIIVNNDTQKISRDINVIVDHTIELKRNYGYGYANNRGAEIANGDIICFLNPDALFSSVSIADILKQFNADAIAIVAPRLVTRSGKTQEWSVGAEMTALELIRNHIGVSRSEHLWCSNDTIQVAWVSGAAMFIKATVFNELKGFDENFFLYYEDIDLCRRAQKINKDVIYCPHVEVQHISGASSHDRKQQKKQYYASQDYYFKKHFHPVVGQFVRVLRVPYRFVKR